MPSNGPKKLGKYEILELVGRGGMGVVYKAVDPEIGRFVGIKMMTNAVMKDPTLLKRFYREAQSAGKLRHPNIVTIYDLGVEEAVPYIVMEFLEGESLDVALRSGRLLSLEEKLCIAAQVCGALAYAHEQSIVHRDVKPGNVMLLKDGTIKLVDFGIARIGTEYVTRAGQLLGSLQYMSPEQVQGAHTDCRTDIFSAGVLLYQLLTNTLPFEGKDAGATLLHILHNSPPPLSNFLHDYPPELDGILQRVLAKNPDDRYQTAGEVALDLSQVEERLKRKRVAEQLEVVGQSVTAQQWDKAREQLLQLVKVDRQNTKVNALLREVQQQIQKQQRVQRIRDLQKQAQEATTRNALDEALRYLEVAVGLDESNAQLRELRDSIKARKERADKVAELLARAKSAFDTQDLEDALLTAQQALSVDADHAGAKELHAAIAQELDKRAKLKQVQDLLESARKHISSRHFTGAIDLLQRAESIDPEAPGVNELRLLATSGQQQERRRKELEQATAEIEEFLNCNDFASASARATEALEKFPSERGLLKLKTLAEKERQSAEKRIYVEQQVSQARRLLEEKKSPEALGLLQEALARYPDEFVFQSMHSLIKEYIDRDKAEQFKANITQKAKEAIRRRAYPEAIEILQAAKRESSSADFDDLLQFTQEEAANHAARQKIDGAAKEAHRLMSADQYEQAVAFLEFTLKEVDDQELRIILEDARGHLEEFNHNLQEAMATARRLMEVQRYSEALRFVEGQATRFGRIPEFAQLSTELQEKKRRVEAFSACKEEVREALANSDFKLGHELWRKFCDEFGTDVDTELLKREIDARESESAVTTVSQALKDCRILLLVGCYRPALEILDRVSGLVTFLPSDVKQDYEFARASAVTGINREHYSDERYSRIKRMAEAGDQPTISDSQWETAGSLALDKPPIPQTAVANVDQLENVLGEVTVIAQHYPDDQKIQSAVGSFQEQLTVQIAALRSAAKTEPETQKPGIEAVEITKTDAPTANKVASTMATQSSGARRLSPVDTVVPRINEGHSKETQENVADGTPTLFQDDATQVLPLMAETRIPSQARTSRPQVVHEQLHLRAKALALPNKWGKKSVVSAVTVLLIVVVAYSAWRINRHVPALVSVQVNTEPPGATVSVFNSDKKCVTPACRFQLQPGLYDVEVRLKGYETVTQVLSVNANLPNEVLVRMRATPADKTTK